MQINVKLSQQPQLLLCLVVPRPAPPEVLLSLDPAFSFIAPEAPPIEAGIYKFGMLSMRLIAFFATSKKD